MIVFLQHGVPVVRSAGRDGISFSPMVDEFENPAAFGVMILHE
jgi:hypothetical protein